MNLRIGNTNILGGTFYIKIDGSKMPGVYCPAVVPYLRNYNVGRNHYYTDQYINDDAKHMVSNEYLPVLRAARRSLACDKVADILMIVFGICGFCLRPAFILFSFALLLKIVVRLFGNVELVYTISLNQKNELAKLLAPLTWLTNSQRVWRMNTQSAVINTKYSAGASNQVTRTQCQVTDVLPFPFLSSERATVLKTSSESLIFLPDRLLIVQGSTIGALSYDDVYGSATTSDFVESEGAPSDSEVLGYTWRYVNKNGGPDRRFNNNYHRPICRYGEMKLWSSSGLNTVIMWSNANLIKKGPLFASDWHRKHHLF